MTAGRELDALVAEKVLGLKKELRIKGTTHVATCYTDNPYFLSGVDKDDVMRYCQPLPYSTSIEAAWLVVEKLSVMEPWSGWHFELYRCAHGHEAKFTGTYEVNGHEDECTGVALSAPHAICLAALKAMEVGK